MKYGNGMKSKGGKRKQKGGKHHDHHIGKDGKCTNCDCDHTSHLHGKKKKKRRSKSRDRDRDRDRKGKSTQSTLISHTGSSSSTYEHGSLEMSTSPRRKKSGSLSIEQSVTTISNMDYDLDDIEFMETSIMSTTNTRIIHKSYDTMDHHGAHHPHLPSHVHSHNNTIDIDDKKYDDSPHSRDNEESKDADDSFSSFVADEEKSKMERMNMDIYEQRALQQEEFVNSSELKCCYAVNTKSADGKDEDKGVWATILSLFGGNADPVEVSRVVSKSDMDNDKK